MKQPRAWQRMLSGRRLDLLDPTPVDIEIEDIAHGLAFVARWNGQTRGDWPYSVAEHSLLVEEIFARDNPGIAAKWRLAAVLHDAPEYVIGDMISPVKAAVGPGYGELDLRLTAAVHLRFGLPGVLPGLLGEVGHLDCGGGAAVDALEVLGQVRCLELDALAPSRPPVDEPRIDSGDLANRTLALRRRTGPEHQSEVGGEVPLKRGVVGL